MINTLRVSGMYSYHLELSYNVSLNAGIEATLHQQRLNWDKLVFADMIDPSTGQIGNSGENPIDNTSLTVPDFSTGLFLSVKEKYYFGVAVDHLSQPALDYYNNSAGSFLYRKYTFHAGGNFNLSRGSYQFEDNAFQYLRTFYINTSKGRSKSIWDSVPKNLYWWLVFGIVTT
ncbi:MAG: type IX secretion system membrane protein PorP/SprF [Bacteroidales bacterium]